MLTSPAIGMGRGKAEEVLRTADVDGSGRIDFNEFVAVMFNPDALTASELERYLVSIFSELAGADSKISREEFAKVFSSGMSQTIIWNLFNEMDVDGDGMVDLIEFKAFIASM